MFFGKKFSGYHKKSLSGLDILVLSIITNGNGYVFAGISYKLAVISVVLNIGGA